MKWVSSLPHEPEHLLEYRTQNPESQHPSDPTLAWEAFRAAPAYSRLKQELIRMQQALCAYCELRLTKDVPAHVRIEHFFPKSRFPGMTFDYRNLLACCEGGTCVASNHYPEAAVGRFPYHCLLDGGKTVRDHRSMSCDAWKEGLDPSDADLLDPRQLSPTARIFFVWASGEIDVDEEACAICGFSPEQARNTVERLNLNCERLVKARRFEFRVFEDEINSYLEDLTPEHAGRFLMATKDALPQFYTLRLTVLGTLAEAWLKQGAQPSSSSGPAVQT